MTPSVRPRRPGILPGQAGVMLPGGAALGFASIGWSLGPPGEDSPPTPGSVARLGSDEAPE